MPYVPGKGWCALTAAELAAVLSSLPPDAPVLLLENGHHLRGVTAVTTWDQPSPQPRVVLIGLPDELCSKCLEHTFECRCARV